MSHNTEPWEVYEDEDNNVFLRAHSGQIVCHFTDADGNDGRDNAARMTELYDYWNDHDCDCSDYDCEGECSYCDELREERDDAKEEVALLEEHVEKLKAELQKVVDFSAADYKSTDRDAKLHEFEMWLTEVSNSAEVLLEELEQ